jgi:hypothetical protein
MSNIFDGKRQEETQFKPGNQAAHKHGGAGAVLAIQEGRQFAGLAAQAEAQVRDDLETMGRAEMVRENAVRLQTAARLYWGAVQTATDAGDLQKLTVYVSKFGWLAGAALRAWDQVKSETPDDGGVSIADIIDAGVNDGRDK